MEIILHRSFLGKDYSVGHIYIGGSVFCDTIEDVDRDIDQATSLAVIRQKKVYGKTAIPTGRYKVELSPSPKYQKKALTDSYFRQYANAMPHLLNVPGFTGILIHPGATANDTEGCVIVGRNLVKGKILQSRDTFSRLYSMLSETKRRGEDIYITITHVKPFDQ